MSLFAFSSSQIEPEFDDLWPLHLVDLRDPVQHSVLYRLLHTLPELILWYLFELVLPLTMEFQVPGSTV